MSLRELLLALGLVVGGGLVVYGVSTINDSAAWILAGLLVAALAYLFATEAG